MMAQMAKTKSARRLPKLARRCCSGVLVSFSWRRKIGDFAQLGVHPGSDDNPDAVSVGRDGSFVSHVEPVAKRRIQFAYQRSVFFYRQRFAG